MKGKTYVLSDIHGNFEIFKRMLEKIQFNSHDQLYILGDICDRGPCSLDIYFYIQKFDNITLLKGNHEYMMQEALKEAISKRIKEKSDNLVGDMASQGTTPRQLTDLIGSLCDLTSGSGDKGTPVVLVQGYFDNYTN